MNQLHGLNDQSPEMRPIKGESYQDFCRRVSEQALAEEKRLAQRDQEGSMSGLAYAILAVLAVVCCWVLAAYLPGVMG
jgi:hypothetical protein